MARTVNGLFDNRIQARDAVQELLEQGFTRDDISVMSKKLEDEEAKVDYIEEDGHEQVEDMAKGAGTGAAIGGAAGLLLGITAVAIPGIGPIIAAGPLAALIAGTGVGATIGGFISGLTRLGVDEGEADTYAEGVRRGGTLISVASPDERADRVVAIMRQHGAIEIDKRAAQWRDEGWTGFEASARDAAFQSYAGNSAGQAAASASPNEITAEHRPVSTQSAGVNQGQIAVPVVEEQLEVGKREVERGGVRVQSRVTETPVEENVELREERVHVERRPVDYTFHGGESEAFKESMIEIKEAYEELIVNKKARVVEEVVVGKDVEQHTEIVRETLRRTDVEVEPIEPERARGAGASSPQQPGTARDDSDPI
ncbi:MAG TPA: DUF2382 domain-containing protein [Pyrinomonadaceae bacterium]|jgi:uncharacterized protein (TIGR02271 family)